MQKKINILISGAVALMISGCVGAMPEYSKSNGKMIIFKTPTVKFADQGFVSSATSEVKVEIYGSGQALMRLRVTPTQTCMSSMACMGNSEFNKKVLNANYPADTLEHIFKGEQIFAGQGLSQSADGFTQNIGSITYSVSSGNISFRDSSNGVKIVVRD